MIILGIETSCDETSASLIEARNDSVKLLSNIVSSQIEIHSKWGGVVPDIAAREHLKNIFPVLESCFKKAGISPSKVDLMAVTHGPGLIPALLIGTNVAKTLSFIWKKPLLGIHHIEGHIYSNFIDIKKHIEFPVLCLVVSGGHTQLILMKDHLKYEIIGQTQDDAAGEAFDKFSRILNLGYPGGPAVSLTAKNFPELKMTKKLPRPMINSKDFNFSFSGLKTAALYLTKKMPEILSDKEIISSVCWDFQQSVIDVLTAKTLKAAEKFSPKTILLAGGVSANTELRGQLGKSIEKRFPSIKYIVPKPSFSVDNAAMIASAAYFRWDKMKALEKKEALENWKKIKAEANLKL